MMKSQKSLVLLFVGMFVLIVLSALLLKNARIDLTENKLYTLSEGTEKILQELPQSVTLTLYFSEKATKQLPALRTYKRRVEEFLNEYVAHADGKLKLSIVDPEPFSEEEDQANAAGLQGVPSGVRGDDIYFGLVGKNEKDSEEIIPFFQPDKEAFLEYQLTRLIYKLGNPKQPKIGIISGLELNGGFDFMTRSQKPAWIIAQQIESSFDVEWLDPDVKTIADDMDVLLLVAPDELSDETALAIDQFVLKGGRVMAFVDPVAETYREPGPMAMSSVHRSDLAKLLPAWGVRLRENAIVGDFANSMVVSLGQRRAPVRHIGLLGLGPDALESQDIVLSGLENINLSSVGILDPVEGAKTRVEALIRSSDQSKPLEAESLLKLANPEDLMKEFKPTGERYLLAARISGPATTAFPEGIDIEVADESASTKKEVKDSSGDAQSKEADKAELKMVKKHIEPKLIKSDNINVMVVADSDILSDRLWVQVQNFFGQKIVSPFADNGSLLLNSLENLSGNPELIKIRGQGRFTRPFTRVEALRKDAEARFQDKQEQLQGQLKSTESKLVELQSKRSDKDGVKLTSEQEQELLKFQNEKLKIRKQLREVQHQLDQDIDALGARLKLINIFAVPLVLTVIALMAVFRRRARL